VCALPMGLTATPFFSAAIPQWAQVTRAVIHSPHLVLAQTLSLHLALLGVVAQVTQAVIHSPHLVVAQTLSLHLALPGVVAQTLSIPALLDTGNSCFVYALKACLHLTTAIRGPRFL